MIIWERCATGSDATGNDVTGSHVIGSHVTGCDVSHVTGSNVTAGDIIFPRFLLTIVVVQNVPFLFIIRFTVSDYTFGIIWSLCCLSFDLWLLIIPLVFSSFPCKGTFCITTIVRIEAQPTEPVSLT